jgi:hypothetical protein
VELTQTNNIKQHCGMKPRIWFQKLNFYCSNHESDEIPIPVKFDHLIEAANIGISPRILNPPWQHRRFTMEFLRTASGSLLESMAKLDLFYLYLLMGTHAMDQYCKLQDLEITPG